MLETVWRGDERKTHVSSFALTVMLYRVPENMTGTDQDTTEIDLGYWYLSVVTTIWFLIYI
jgi:hypothetical protein